MHDTDVIRPHDRPSWWSLARFRHHIAVILLAVFVLVSTTRTLLQSVRDAHADDEVSIFVQHMQTVRPLLPQHDGTIGYISNLTNPSAFFKAYLLTQYVLAPLVVTNIGDAPANTPFGVFPYSTSHVSPRIIIGVFSGDVPMPLLKQQHLIVVQRFAGGIVLLQREE